MKVLVTGKNLDVGAALRGHVEARVSEVAERYLDAAVKAHVVVEKLRGRFISDCSLRLSTGLVLQAHGEHTEAMASFEAAASHLERQLRRYKQRLKKHHRARPEPLRSEQAASFVIAAAEDDEDTAAQDLNPAVVAETPHSVPELSVGEAVMKLDISTVPFVLFRNARGGQLNVVYRRPDGHIGWVDPGQSAKT
jgi:ribosomal subunit interface protein